MKRLEYSLLLILSCAVGKSLYVPAFAAAPAGFLLESMTQEATNSASNQPIGNDASFSHC